MKDTIEIAGIRFVAVPDFVLPPGALCALISEPADPRDFDPKKHVVLITDSDSPKNEGLTVQ